MRCSTETGQEASEHEDIRVWQGERTGVLDRQAVHKDLLLLADAVDAVKGLVFDGSRPREICSKQTGLRQSMPISSELPDLPSAMTRFARVRVLKEREGQHGSSSAPPKMCSHKPTPPHLRETGAEEREH